VLDVTVEGPLDESTGRVVNLATLDELVTRYVVTDFDHRNLNEDLPDFQSAVPTSENLTVAIEERLKQAWRSGFTAEWPRLSSVRLEETKRNSFEHKT
jgi:6-pyruvoyltetrahydropterin/6-carboxytetrahydropterin synthase